MNFNFNEAQKANKQEQKQVKKIFNPRKYEKPGFSIQQIVEMKQTFDLFDRDKGGTLSFQELRDAMQILGFINDDESALAKVIDQLDQNGDKNLSFDEFMDIMFANIAETDTDKDLEKVFSYFIDLGNSKFLADDDDDQDYNNNNNNEEIKLKVQPTKGEHKRNQSSKTNKSTVKQPQPINKQKISIQMLRNIAKEIGEDVEDEDLIEMLQRADRDDDGQINFLDFKYIIKWKNDETQSEYGAKMVKNKQANQSMNNISQRDQDI